MAATERSTSASLVDQFDTEMRMAAMPCQVVPLSRQRAAGLDPADDLAGAAVVVAAGVGEADQRLVEHDLVEDLDPSAAPRAAAKRPAWPQHRSTRSATPERPSERSAAQTGNPWPAARTRGVGVGVALVAAPGGQVAGHGREGGRWASGWATNTSPLS